MYDERRPVRRRRVARTVKRVFGILGATFMHAGKPLAGDLAVLAHTWRLSLGMVFVVVGLLSFASDRYCDGNASSYYACTRPSTYYYYPWWSIALVVVGTLLLVVWVLRRERK